MLNEEKIILMTQMASYEENEGKKNMAIGRYFRSDYIAIQVLKSVLCATIAYAVCFALFSGIRNCLLPDLLFALCQGEKKPEMLL